MKTKIVFLLNKMIVGGIETVFITLIDDLLKTSRYDISVIVKLPVTEPFYLDFFKTRGLPVFFLREKKTSSFCAKLRWKFEMAKRKRLLIKELSSADVVVDYTNCSFANSLMNIKTPKIGWYHGASSVYRQMVKHKDVFNVYDKFVCLTHSACDDFIAQYPSHKQKIVQIYNPFNYQRIQQRAENASSIPLEKFFCFVARMDANDKDHETVIKAFTRFLQNNPEAKLYLIGDGPNRSNLEKMVEDFHVEKNIVFTGTLTNPYGYMKGAIANILSSYNEGFGVVLVEAQALKTLNIATDCPNGPAEILLHGKGGILFPVGDVNCLEKALADVWNNKIDREEMVENAYISLERFSLEKITPQIEDLFRSVLK